MEFLAPLMLLGVAGAAIPVVIHLVGRRRAPVRRFGAIDFLLGQNRRVARRLRVRELLLLAVRVAVCAAIPLALAKPLVSCTARGPIIARGPQAVALVLDNSFAMGYRRGGETLLAEARARALKVLQALGPEADVALFLAAEGSERPVELARDHIRLRAAIEDAALVGRPADLRRTLRDAAALLASAPHESRRVYLFSALTAGAFPDGELPWPEGQGPALHVVELGPGALANAAVVGARAEPDPEGGPRGLHVVAEVANYGPTPIFDRAVSVRLDGRTVVSGLVTVRPGETVTKRFALALAANSRSAELVVELEPDALPADDRRFLSVELRTEVRVLVVDGDPRTVRHEDETFYLETALRPGDRGDSALAVVSTTVDDLPRRRLADFEVVFLANVPALAPDRVAELAGWVRRGGGLLVAVGDRVDPDAYNAGMAELLAQELRAPRALAPSGAAKAERAGKADRIARVEVDHPIFAVFPEGAAALRAARFHTIFLVGPTTRVGERRTLARFAGGAPALVEARLDAGRLLLFTSTLDRDWNDLPIHPGYLPLVQQMARHLARAPAQSRGRGLVVGRTRDLEVQPGDRRLEVASPGGQKTAYEEDRLEGRTSVAFTATSEPGFYRVSARGADGSLKPRRGADFFVNLDPRGSDTRRIAPDSLPGQGATATAARPGGRPAGAPPRRHVELWHGLAAALLLFLLGEAWLTR